MTNWQQVYETWDNFAPLDSDLRDELEGIKADPEKLEDAFYKELSFGTGGMRGVIGVGTNRMNIYTVRKAVDGLARHLRDATEKAEERGVAISYDCRYMSKEFALEAAKVLGSYGIRSYIFDTLHPTPLLSFAVRYLQTAAGIMITASHNPPEYNGLKVYNEDGGQIVPKEADKIVARIQEVENELTVPVMTQEDLTKHDLLHWIGAEVDHAYLQQLLRLSRMSKTELEKEKDLPVVFTPLHGTSAELVMRGLEQLHFSNVHIVEEQAMPDPEFSTVASPNPEEHEAFTMAIEKGNALGAEILLGTDPDSDRLGVAAKNSAGEYQVLTGNQLGSLFIDYILSHAPADQLNQGRVLKTIVTTELGRAIADSYGVQTVDTLTGFKYIGEKIHEYETSGENFLFGFEESYGYLISDIVRDKDAVQAAVMAAEMAYYWRKQGKTLFDALDDLYQKYGYYLEGMSSMTLKGKEGSKKIALMMDTLREKGMAEIAGVNVLSIEDYLQSRSFSLIDGKEKAILLPKENVLKFILENDNWVCLRPSGTEPKIKCYFGVCESNRRASEEKLTRLKTAMEKTMSEIVTGTDLVK
ncbi:phospho-sugar mutase [Virgibacillus sp. 179-BFC.A HS]|uniref:phosphoglucomutase (alpha-D-glucose-1,6-bisphosphate-dependent) n=1 Tax=Tigheibacillus jepli TaxID=3035914 RepID=A0ABU5CDS4_9BACI|nr:phospho-sugar mutase [Virgibacillus sp. 179-BFC.A HS]MDY0404494.1 phospho-sugar mutase [Virgibacillus sp. 179-BFC.A HS]